MSETIEKKPVKERLKPPSMYNVVMHNDDYTTMEFVVAVLMYVFNKTQEQAVQIMMQIHQQGKGVAGTYTHDIATTKQEAAMDFAKSQEHPLQITVEQI